MKEIVINSIKKESPFVIAELSIDGNLETIKTEISDNFIQYAVTDRIDAYVLGLFIFSIQNGYDFVSELPITDELKYNLECHLIPSLCNADKTTHKTCIKAPIIPVCKRVADFIASGISCGVDSLYTIQQHTNMEVPENSRIDTLAFFNIGSSMKGTNELRTPLVKGRLELAEKFAKEYNFNFLFIESNLHLLINKYVPYNHIQQHTYMMLFCVNLIQPCIKAYYYSSGYPYEYFSLNMSDSAHFDLLSMFCASIGDLKFYSTGGDVTRIEKTKSLLDYEPAQKYLNVCVNQVSNCGLCFKCIRTILSIDGLGGIDKFSQVFDIEYYKKNKFFYLKRLYLDAKYKQDESLREIQPLFHRELTGVAKIKFYLSALFNHIKAIFK